MISKVLDVIYIFFQLAPLWGQLKVSVCLSKSPYVRPLPLTQLVNIWMIYLSQSVGNVLRMFVH